jgi:anthranilate/para-aminobenzoate synthase component I
MTSAASLATHAAAHTPGTVSVALPAFGARPAVHALASLRAPVVCVPADQASHALARLAPALDALCAAADAPATLPIATLWLSYDAARTGCDPRPLRDLRPPGDASPAALLAPHAATAVWRADTGEVLHRAGSLDDLRALDAHAREEGDRGRLRLRSETTRADFERAVGIAREEIAAGNVYLVNLARRVRVTGRDDLAAAVARRVIDARPARGMLAHVAGVIVGGMSMELALRWERRAGVAWSEPIKGTRPRGVSEAQDRAEVLALQGDLKERAENAMAVDVHRNDLSRVATAVTTPSLFAVETHAFVHHLVSRVRAEVPVGLGSEAMLRAMLPVGSVTGAPKLAAMDLIARLEPTRRGLYTGVYGVVFGDGSVELTVAIRTAVIAGDTLTYGVGGGVVWDSDPAREWEELGWKLRALR